MAPRPHPRSRPLARGAAFLATATLVSGCFLIDGFGDLEPGGAGGAASTTGTPASGSGSTGADATASSVQSGGGAGDGGAGPGPSSSGAGGEDVPTNGTIRRVVAFGATGEPDCETSVTDVLRIPGATVAVGTTFGSGSCVVIEGDDSSLLNFFPEGNVFDWLAVVPDDDSEPIEFQQIVGGESQPGPYVTGLPGYVIPPVRLNRLASGDLAIMHIRHEQFGGPELYVQRFDVQTRAQSYIAQIKVAAENDFIVGTDVQELADGRVTVVGTYLSPDGGYSTAGDADSPDGVLADAPVQASFRGVFDVTLGRTDLLGPEPSKAIWAQVETGSDFFRVGAEGFADSTVGGDCFFDGEEDLWTYLTEAGVDLCANEQGYPPADEPTAFPIHLARGESIAVTVVTGGGIALFGIGNQTSAPVANAAIAASGDLVVGRVRAHGERFILAGAFAGELNVDSIAPAESADERDAFALVYSGIGDPPGHIVTLGSGEDGARSGDIDADSIVLGGDFAADVPGIQLLDPETARAGYLAVIEDRPR